MTEQARKRKRWFYELDDRRCQILQLTDECQAVVRDRYKCPGRGCWHLSQRWHESPEPIDLIVKHVHTTALVEGIEGLGVIVLDMKLMDSLGPYCREMVVGRVYVDRGSAAPALTRFVTLTAPLRRRIQSDRGRFCRHSHYECCPVFVNTIGWASGAIVERTLDDRGVYIDQSGHVLVDRELAEQLKLRARFSGLWLYRVDVVPEPLDGEVLPGDPGWDGVFRPGPPPVMPERMPKRGRVTQD